MLLASVGATRDPDLALLAARGRGQSRFSGMELVPGAHLPGRCRQCAARLPARLSGARRRVGRRLKIALILPSYFLADATLTLLRRLIRGERVWQAHREHFYQRAVQRGLSHSAVVWRVIAANLLLLGCGWAAENGGGIAMLAPAALIVAVLLANLGTRLVGREPGRSLWFPCHTGPPILYRRPIPIGVAADDILAAPDPPCADLGQRQGRAGTFAVRWWRAAWR